MYFLRRARGLGWQGSREYTLDRWTGRRPGRVRVRLGRRGMIDRSPGCRQGAILVLIAARHYCGSEPLRPWDILDRRRDLRVARGTCDRYVTSDATGV